VPAGRATSHFPPDDKSPIFYKTASAEIDPCDIIIAPLLGRACDSGNAVAGGFHLRVPLRSQNREFSTPRGENYIADCTKIRDYDETSVSLTSSRVSLRQGKVNSPTKEAHPPPKTPHVTPSTFSCAVGIRSAAIRARARNYEKEQFDDTSSIPNGTSLFLLWEQRALQRGHWIRHN
jgi:hypothetical protein